jgi:diguanylate cyclase (GGDEF)-like protein
LTIAAALIAFGASAGVAIAVFVVGPLSERRLVDAVDRLAEAMGGAEPTSSTPARKRRGMGLPVALADRVTKLTALASVDPLTRVSNRQSTLRLLVDEIARANRYGRPLAVALIDIDHFKRINDSHGHPVGDLILGQIAGHLKASVRAADALGRYGGEEFIVVMPETDLAGGLTAAEHLRRVVGKAHMTVGDQAIPVTISIGVAAGGGTESIDFERILRNADTALYSAKAQGRDQVQPFRPPDDDAGIRRSPIDNAARRHAREIGQAAFDASNRELLKALAERPGWAGGASQLIAHLAGEVARTVGLPEGDVDRIRTASLLHDLGKLAIPDEILSKPAALNAHEWRTVVEHPKIGQVVLEQAGSIRDAAAIVLHHHEWFDGRGYPYGLAGAEIPLGSRIVAIADAYEAMISHRPYKSAMSHAEALLELQRHAGVQFDPALVGVFVDLFGPGVAQEARSARRRGRVRVS